MARQFVVSINRNLTIDWAIKESVRATWGLPRGTAPCHGGPTLTLELSEDLRREFDATAHSLLSRTGPLPPHPVPPPLKGSMAELPIAAELAPGDVMLINPVLQVDALGILQGIEIRGRGIRELLGAEPVATLRQLAVRVATRPELQRACGIEYVTTHLTRWVDRGRIQPEAVAPWTADLLEALRRDVRPQKVLIPLDGLQIERPFRVGKVSLNYFSVNDVERLVEGLPRGEGVGERYRERMTREYRGRPYALYECEAEDSHAVALATDATERSLDVLRFFHPAAQEVRARCFFGRYGQSPPGSVRSFLASGDATRPRRRESTERSLAGEVLDEQFLAIIARPLEAASRLLSTGTRTPLEAGAINAVALYARGVLSAAPQDRLLHALTSVESLLLRNRRERIGRNLARRMIRVIRHQGEDEMALAQVLRRGYRLRSDFLHHGLIPAEIPTLNRTLNACWRTVFCVLLNAHLFSTKGEMIDKIEAV